MPLVTSQGHSIMHTHGEAKPNLTPPEASDYLRGQYGIRLAVKTLAKLRCVSSTGPIFVRAGRAILYPQDGLDAYARATVSAPMRSTSDGAQRRSTQQEHLIAA